VLENVLVPPRRRNPTTTAKPAPVCSSNASASAIGSTIAPPNFRRRTPAGCHRARPDQSAHAAAPATSQPAILTARPPKPSPTWSSKWPRPNPPRSSWSRTAWNWPWRFVGRTECGWDAGGKWPDERMSASHTRWGWRRESPNPNLQVPKKIQTPSAKTRRGSHPKPNDDPIAAVYDRRNAPRNEQPSVIDRRYRLPDGDFGIASGHCGNEDGFVFGAVASLEFGAWIWSFRTKWHNRMTLGTLLLRNLAHHWRGLLAVGTGVAVGATVLTGSSSSATRCAPACAT